MALQGKPLLAWLRLAALVPYVSRYAWYTFKAYTKASLHFLSRKIAHQTRLEATIHGDSYCSYLALMQVASSAVIALPNLTSFADFRSERGVVISS